MAGLGAYCVPCRSRYRSWAEHGSSAKHRAATTSVRSTGPRGSSAYSGPTIRVASDAAYDAMLEERETLAQPPTIDELEPVELGDGPTPAPAERDHRPDPCERCGRTFRTDKGRAWHVANNPQCVKWMTRKSRRLAA
jgi:hypothetical protein